VAADPWPHLQRLIDAGDVEGAVEAVAALEESERRGLAGRARERRAHHGEALRWTPDSPIILAATAVEFACTTPSQVVDHEWHPWYPIADWEEALLRSRSRTWLDEWAQRIADARGHVYWGLMRRLVREGLCAKPEGEGYLVGAFNGMRAGPLAEQLRQDPAFLEEDLLRLFAVEGAGELNFTNADRNWRDEDKWSVALVELAGEGVVSRARLLDESLAALRRDFTPYVARWHAAFHELLGPTVDERAERIDDLLALLGSRDPAVVGFAVRALAVLEKAERVEPRRLLAHLGPAVVVSQKSHALRAVKLAARALRRGPEAAAAGGPVLVEALGHEAREVQEGALEVLERQGADLSAEARARIRELAGAVDPALRARAAALAPSGPAAPVVRAEAAPPPARPIDRFAPRLSTAEPLVPVRDLDDLLDRAAVVLDRDDDPEEVELVLDGIARMCDRRPGDGRARALVGRAETLLGWSPGTSGARMDRAAFAPTVAVLAWLGDPPDRLSVDGAHDSPVLAVSRWVSALLANVADRSPYAALATPTHRGGWVDPLAAVERVADRPVWPVDLAQMLLRLAPDRREEARAAAEDRPGGAARVLAHALGSEAPLPDVDPVVRIAAAQARDPERELAARTFDLATTPLDDWRFFEMTRHQVRDGPSPASPADHLERSNVRFAHGSHSRLERWLALVAPINRERFYGIGVRRLALGPDRQVANGTDDILAPLAGPTEPVGPAARRLIALGLGAYDVAHRTMAADVTIAALGDRRLDAEGLGTALAEVFRHRPAVVASRWAGPLADVAAAGRAQHHDVQRAVEAVLAVASDPRRRGLADLVDLVRRLAMEAGRPVADPAARAFLEGLAPKSKAGRAAAEALAV
jgi:hypothetical protein